MKNITYYNAGAGSGKTHRLTEKLAEIFSSGDALPENVILTTFTKTAAADFKRKTREKLLSSGMLDMASSLEDAKIGTVHSVGLYYIRKYWYILGRSSTFNEMDDDTKNAYISRTLSEVAKEEDITLFHNYIRNMELKDYNFWRTDLRSIIESCDTFGITDLDACKDNSIKHIMMMYPDGGAEEMIKVTERLFSIAKRWRQEFNEFKKKNNLLSFSDMETLFLALLDNELVQADIRSTIKYVFVDEFQDSNQVQLKIFDKLSELVTRSYWVGDPKQAIYRFRGCDTELVAAIMSHLRTSTGQGFEYSRELDKSWRSLKPLVTLANSIFVPLFSNILDPEDIKLEAQRTCTPPDNPPLLYNWDLEKRLLPDKKLPSANHEMLIDAVAAKIMDVLEGRHHIKYITDKDTKEVRKVRPGDIAILMLKDGEKKNISLQANALRRYGIPVDCQESYSADRAEIALVKCLATYMVQPDSPLLKAEISRLMYGKSLDELISENFDYEIFKALDEIRSSYQDSSVSNLIIRIVHGLNLPQLCGKWGDAELRSRVLDAIIQQARKYEDEADATIEGFISSFPKTLEIPGDPEGVKVMTYHKSKGLEWPIVILDTASHESYNIAMQHFCCGVTVSRMDKPAPGNLYSDFTMHYCPGFFKSVSAKPSPEVERNIASSMADYWEDVVSDCRRLFYVGMTRARDYLITLSMNHKVQEFFKECGCAPDLKKCTDQTYHDLWGGSAPQIFFEKIRDNIPEPQKEDETLYRAIKPSDVECLHIARHLSPSKMEGEDAKVEHVADISGRITVNSCPSDRYAALGTCIHDMFAIYDLSMNDADAAKAFTRIAAAHRMGEILPEKGEIVSAVRSLYEYLKRQYGPGKVHKEYPFMYLNEQGQIVNGSIDLLWETADGIVVLDYKNYPGYDDVTDPQSQFHAGKYGPQLNAYRHAASKVHGGKIKDILIFYSVQGRIVRLFD